MSIAGYSGHRRPTVNAGLFKSLPNNAQKWFLALAMLMRWEWLGLAVGARLISNQSVNLKISYESIILASFQ